MIRENPNSESRLYRRISRRMYPIIAILFVLIGASGVIVTESSGRNTLNQRREDALRELSDGIANRMTVAVNDAQNLANSSFVRQFNLIANNSSTLGLTGSQDTNVPLQNMLRTFNDLIVLNGDWYRAVRYMNYDLTIWGEAVREGDQISLSTTYRQVSMSEMSESYRQFIDEENPVNGPLVGRVVERGDDQVLSIYVPVNGSRGSNGIIELQVSVAPIVEQLVTYSPNSPLFIPERRAILVNADNTLLADTSTNASALDLLVYLDNNPGVLTNAAIGTTIVSTTEIAPHTGIDFPWRVVLQDDLIVALMRWHIISIVTVLLVVLFAVAVAYLTGRLLLRVLTPLENVRSLARDVVGSESLPDRALDDGDTMDELVHSIQVAAQRIEALAGQLDASNHRHNRDIEVAARIGRETATLTNIEDLLNHAIELISRELGFYHAQVFLIDDVGEYAVLVYSQGDAGRKMLDRNHKLAVGSKSVVGMVASLNQPVIVNDTENDESGIHGYNPLLPNTRAEMGLPLLIEDRVIGVLDIQSTEPNVFQQDDLPTFRLLADQIAVAINKARLLNESNERVSKIDELNRQLTRSAWEKAAGITTDTKRAYRYNLLDVEAVDPDEAASGALDMPISIRGEVIGTLSADAGAGKGFSEGDQLVMRAIADRVALAIENARLFQETQLTLAETSMLYQLTRHLNEASTLRDILNAIVISVMTDAGGAQVWIFDDYVHSASPEWMEVKEDLAIAEREAASESLKGVRLHVPDHPFLRKMTANQVILINDSRQDSRLDTGLQIVFRRMQARAAVLIPLVVRGEWIGLIIVEFEEARTFSEQEGRLYSALIDQAGIAIDNRLLLEQTEAHLSRNENLYAASRIINTAQNYRDLVYAAVATTSDPNLNFTLALLEGELDESGWPTMNHVVAQSDGGMVDEVDFVQPVFISQDSPIRNREPEVVRDGVPLDSKIPTSTPWLRDNDHYRFIAIFPLFSINQPIALFFIMSPDLRVISTEDYEVYRALTGQMSTQLENRRLLQRTEAALDETRRLYVASRAVASAQDTQKVYEASVEHLARPLLEDSTEKPQSWSIALMLAAPEPHKDTQQLDCVFAWNSSEKSSFIEQGVTLSTRETALAALVQENDSAVNIRDTNEFLGFASEEIALETLRNNGARSAVVMPIRTRQYWFGLMLCQSDQLSAFDEQYTRFVDALSGQIAIALENFQLFHDAQAEAQRAQLEARRAFALAEAAQLATQVGLDFEKSVGEVLSRVAAPAGYDRWLLVRVDEMDRHIIEIVSEGIGLDADDPEEGVLISESTHPIAHAITLNRDLMLNNIVRFPAYEHLDAAEKQALAERYGKSIALPISHGDDVVAALMIGHAIEYDDLDEGDERLIGTLATQISIAFENRRLFRQVQSEQQTLSSTLSTLPAGVLVLDPKTMRPIIANERAKSYLGDSVDAGVPFSAEAYQLFRTGTELPYPNDELPVQIALASNDVSFTDDVAVINDDQQYDLLVNAAPIYNNAGDIFAIVATFSDISNLRSMENTLQEHLQETVMIYEAQRELTSSKELDNVLDTLGFQLAMLQPGDAHIILVDPESGFKQVSRSLIQELEQVEDLNEVLDRNEFVVVQDVERHPLSERTRAALMQNGIRSLGTVPLVGRDTPLGWLLVTHEMPDFFTLEHERILTQLADIGSTAIENRYLIQSTRAALRETATLYTATTTINRARDLIQLGEALKGSLATLNPDVSAAFLTRDGLQSNEIVTSAGDKDISLLRAAILRHDLPEQGLFIEDLRAIEEPNAFERDLLNAAGDIRAVAAINLRVKDGAGGRLLVGYQKSHRFVEAELRFLTAVSDSVSVVLDNIVLVDEIQSTLEETTILYQAGRSLTESTNPKDILGVVVDYLIQPHVDHAFIGLLNGSSWDAPDAVVDVAASWSKADSLDLDGISLSADQFPAWTKLATSQLVTINDTFEDESIDEMELIGFESMEARSVVIIPLRVPTRVIGAIWIGSREVSHYTERDRRTHQSFGEQASLSMEASYLLRQTERRARQLETTAEVSGTIGKILDLEQLLPQLVYLIRDAFGYDHTQIFLMDSRDEYAELRASTGEAGRQLLEIKHKLAKGSDSVIGQVTATGKPSVALDIADAEVIHMPNPYLPLTRSEMALPLVIKGRVIGALDVQSNTPNAFSQDDIGALITLAAQISIAIDNANLYEEAQSQADRMSLLFDITTVAAAAESLTDALSRVAEKLYESQDALNVILYLNQTYADSQDEEETFQVMEATAIAGTQQPLSEIETVRYDDENNVISFVSRERQPVIIEDITTEPKYLPVSSAARSAVIVPMLTGHDPVGLIVMEDARPGRYNYEAIQLLLTLSGSLSAIVQSAQLLERLTRANEELRELDRLKSDFLANMSHELRTPLNSIIGFSRVMLKGIDGPLTEMQEQDLTTIFTSGQHLLGLINDILDQAKIAAGKMDLKMDYFDIKPLVEGVKSIGIGLVKDKPINIIAEIAPSMPQAYGDEFRSRQVLLNLVSNAAKFTSEGSVVIRVFPYMDEEIGKRMIQIDVIDSGIGIAESDLPLLFEAFQQIDSSLTRTQGGTGLGLPIAKSLIEMQGGQMAVHSEINVGSTFSITVPTEPMFEEEDEEDDGDLNGNNPMDNRDNTPTSRPTLETRAVPKTELPPRIMQVKRQVLVIEDNPEMVDQYRRALQRDGYEVMTATIQLEAEAMASGLRPTLIVMDVNFSGGAGWKIIENLKGRDDTFDIPIVVVTLSNEKERILEMDAFAFLQRPFLPEDLLSIVQEAERESNLERILIIDDQPDDLRLLTNLLDQNSEYRVFTASGGQEGISLVARRRPDLVILDLRMPEMDGFAVLEEMRSHPETSGIPIMVITGEMSLNADERDQLNNIHVLQKTDISQEDYDEFLAQIADHLNGSNGHN